jgi:transcriptional regulator with XRE-family HTH domain
MKDLLDILPKKHSTTASVIKSFRNNFNISQVELADAIGLTQANISSYENFDPKSNKGRKLGLENALKIATFFGIDPIELLYPNGLEEGLPDYKKIKRNSKNLLRKKNIA